MALLKSTDDSIAQFSRINAGEFIELEANSRTATETDKNFFYTDGTSAFFWNGTSSTTVGSGGSGSPSGGMQDAYSVDRSVTVDSGAVAWTDATTGAANTMTFVKSGAGSGDVINIDMDAGIATEGIVIDSGGGARTASDIRFNDDSTGNHSCIDINSSGNSASIGLDWTGSFTGSPGGSAVSLTFDNSDNLSTEGLLITRGTGIRTASAISIVDSSTGSDDLINIDVSGVFTGDIIDITTSAAATGNAMFINLDSAVAMTALHVEGSGARTQPYIELETDQTGSANMIQVTANGAFTGDILAIDGNAAVGANLLLLDGGAGTRTAPMVLVTADGDGASAGATFMDINVTSTGATGSGLFDIDVTGVHTGALIDVGMGAAATGAVIAVDMNLAVGAPYLTLDAGNGIRTVDLIDVTFDGSGDVGLFDINHTNTGSGNLIDIDVSGIHTGNILDITYSAAATGDAVALDMTSAVAASALVLTAAGARTDDLVKITDSSTGNSHVFDINMTGVYTGNVFDVVMSAAATGEVLHIDMDASVAGSAIVIDTAGSRTDDLIKIVDTSAGNSHIFDIDFSGIYTGNCLDITYGTAAATGNAVDLNMGTNVAGMAISVGSAGTGVSGEGSCLDISHTGDLVAGADCVRILSTGNHSTTSHILAVEATTGASGVGTYAIYANATGANVEGLKVDAGAVVFDETLLVTGAVTFSSTLAYTKLSEDTTGTNTITAAESGATFFLNSGTEFVSTLPAPAAGLHFDFIVVAAPSGANYTVVTNGSDNIIKGQASSAAGDAGDTGTADDTISFVSGQSLAGDRVHVVSDGTSWFAYAWTAVAAGVTFTQAS